MKNNSSKKYMLLQQGLTLIELMVALAVGMFLVLGIVQLYSNVSSINRVQTGLARLQENGRFAVLRMSTDLRMTGAQYCAATSNAYPDFTTGYQSTRATSVWVNNVAGLPSPTAADDTPPVPAAGEPWLLSSRFYLQGHECDSVGSCIPNIAASVTGSDTWGVPSSGTSVGQRALGADVVTVRYLVGEGDSIAADTNDLDPIVTTTNIGNPPLEFEAGDLALLSSCLRSDVFAVTAGGNNLSHLAGDGNVADVSLTYERGVDARVYNFSKNFRTITYYLGIKLDPNNSTRKISSLYRQENGTAQEIIEGVERMDVLYAVETGAGTTSLLTADQVESRNGGALTCPKTIAAFSVTTDPGCLWDSVKTIEVSLLLNTVENYAPTENEPYTYSPDGSSVKDPAAGIPSGLSPGNMMRREFNFTVNLRNKNL